MGARRAAVPWLDRRRSTFDRHGSPCGIMSTPGEDRPSAARTLGDCRDPGHRHWNRPESIVCHPPDIMEYVQHIRFGRSLANAEESHLYFSYCGHQRSSGRFFQKQFRHSNDVAAERKIIVP